MFQKVKFRSVCASTNYKLTFENQDCWELKFAVWYPWNHQSACKPTIPNAEFLEQKNLNPLDFVSLLSQRPHRFEFFQEECTQRTQMLILPRESCDLSPELTSHQEFCASSFWLVTLSLQSQDLHCCRSIKIPLLPWWSFLTAKNIPPRWGEWAQSGTTLHKTHLITGF